MELGGVRKALSSRGRDRGREVRGPIRKLDPVNLPAKQVLLQVGAEE